MGLWNALRQSVRRATGSARSGRVPAARTRPTRKLALESLEGRRLLAAVTIGPADSIQAAVDAAAPGTTIYLRPGTYYQSVTVNKPSISLVGLGPQKPVIEDPGGTGPGLANGIVVTDAGDRFQARNLVVKDFDDNGIFAAHCDNFVFSQVDAVATGDYGLFPVGAKGGLIEQCTATGLTDSGIYVGSSTNITVSGCRAWANVVGMEIENASNVNVVNNVIYDNTAGIGVFLLPGGSVKSASDVWLRNNVIINNNRANFGDPDDLVAFTPPGIGIFVLGVDRVTIERNTVIGNSQFGIGFGSSLIFLQSGHVPPSAFAGIEPNPDGALVQHNIVIGNGLHPTSTVFPVGDLVWDKSGVGNRWQLNLFHTSDPLGLH